MDKGKIDIEGVILRLGYSRHERGFVRMRHMDCESTITYIQAVFIKVTYLRYQIWTKLG